MGARISVFGFLLLLSSTAVAGPNDFRLNAPNPDPTQINDGILFKLDRSTDNDPSTPDLITVITQDERYFALIGELAYVFSPRAAAPAETLGHSGFHVGLLWSGTMVSNQEIYWLVTDQGQSSGSPNGLLQTLQLDVRKGLPLSFELGTNFTWLVGSNMFAPGLEIRWALHEGYHLAPDLGLRAGVNHVVGNRDLSLTVIGLDVVLSRSFGLVGMVNIAPYVSYSLMMLATSSRVIDATPVDDTDQADLKLPSIGLTEKIEQKLTIGSRFLFSLFNISIQGEFEFLPKTTSGVSAFGSVATITTKLGLDY